MLRPRKRYVFCVPAIIMTDLPAVGSTVPLAARIIRTHATTKAGTVKAAMNMSVRYQ